MSASYFPSSSWYQITFSSFKRSQLRSHWKLTFPIKKATGFLQLHVRVATEGIWLQFVITLNFATVHTVEWQTCIVDATSLAKPAVRGASWATTSRPVLHTDCRGKVMENSCVQCCEQISWTITKRWFTKASTITILQHELPFYTTFPGCCTCMLDMPVGNAHKWRLKELLGIFLSYDIFSHPPHTQLV